MGGSPEPHSRVWIDGDKLIDLGRVGNLKESANKRFDLNVIGSAKIMLAMPAERMGTLYRELGFGVSPQTGFPGEARGQLRPWAQWMARAYTIFTTEGQLLPLSLMKRDAHPIGKRLITKTTAQEVTRMMEMAVLPGGTAPRAQVPGYRVAGKTGTAHKAEAGGYAEHKYVSSFVGFAPVTNPRFIVAVMLDEPQGAKYFGGDVGGPVFSSVMGNALRMMGVPPDAPTDVMNAARPKPMNARTDLPGGEG